MKELSAEELLKSSEERYRQIVETAEEGVWLINETGVTTFVNGKMASMLGYLPAEMLNKSLFDFMDEEQKAIALRNMNRRREGVREHHDFILRHKGGRRIWTVMAASPTYNKEGKFSGALAMVSDVSLKKQNETLLAAQEHIFELLVKGVTLEEALNPLVRAIESMAEGAIGSILLLSEDGKRLRTGSAPNLPEAFNLAINDTEIGPSVGTCGTAAFRDEMVIVDDIAHSPLWANFLPLARKFGLAACWSSPIHGQNGKVVGTFAFYFREVRSPSEEELNLVRDYSAAAALVIKHVRILEHLKQSEERFRQLAEASSDGVAIHENAKILLANEYLAKKLGYSMEELIGKDIRDLAKPEYRDLITKKIESGLDTTFVLEALKKDGCSLWGEVNSRAAVYQGRPVRLTAVRDVSAQKRLEEQRELLLAQEITARIEAERSIQIRDEFLAIATHELKTPLTPLKIELQLLRRFVADNFEKSTPKIEQIMKVIELGDLEFDRLNRLITDLLDVTRIAAGRLQVKKEETDFSKIVSEVLNRLEREIASTQSKLVLSIEPSVIGQWDPLRLDQIVTNLLTNALKYGNGQPIEMSLSTDAAFAILKVRDHGIGIKVEDQSKIFERFVRVAPMENYGGLGLGLYIVSQIVSAHGGKIRVESKPDAGACFTVELPKAALPE
ncbi:MAG: PAS domain S-box protein [Bdellovibrionota bacterium]